MKSFKELSEELHGKKAVFTFGRMNPPSLGHELVFSKVLETSTLLDATPFVFVSQKHDENKNPLSLNDKLQYIALGMPWIVPYINTDENIVSPFDAVKFLGNSGYKDITMIVGADRVDEFKESIGRYVNYPDSALSLPINKFTVLSAGERTSSDETVAGVSASKMREAAINNDFLSFSKGLPSNLSIRFGKELFNKLRAIILKKDDSEDIFVDK